MDSVTQKARLLRLTREEHDALDAVLATITPEQMEQSNLVGAWSVKQTLAHVSWWERDVVSEVLYGVEIDPGLDGKPWDTERANALVALAQRDAPLADVLAAYHASFAEILHMLEDLPDDRLDDEAIHTFIANNTTHHYREHRDLIVAALSDARDTARDG